MSIASYVGIGCWLLCAAAFSTAYAQATNEVDLLMRGRIALEDGFPHVAEQAFREGIASVDFPEDKMALANDLLLQALVQQEKYDDIEYLLGTLSDGTNAVADVVAYWGAVVLHNKSRYADAADQLSSFQTNWPDSRLAEPALRLLGASRLKSGDVKSAAETFESFTRKYPESTELSGNRLDWGKTLVFLGQLQDAIQAMQPVMLDANAGNLAFEARYWIGKTYLQAGETDKAGAVLAPLVAAGTTVPEGLRVKGVLAVAQVHADGEEEGEAVKLLSASLKDIQDADLKHSVAKALARMLLDSGRLDEALPLIKSLLSEKPNEEGSAALQLELGDAFLDAERFDDAVVIYQQFLEAFANAGGHARACQGLGWALLGLGRHAEAAMAFQKAYDLFSDPEQKMVCLFKIGDARFKNEQYQQALESYRQLTDEFKGSEYEKDASFQIGACLAELKQYDDAEKAFNAVIAAAPDSSRAEEALLRIGELHSAHNDWKQAAAAYERLMQRGEKSTSFAEALHGRGMARYQMWLPEALDDFNRIVSEFSESDVAEHSFFMRAMCEYRLGRDVQALAVFNAFLERYPDSTWAPSVLFWIGRLSYNAGDFEKAEKEFLQFVDRYPKHRLADRAVYRAGLSAYNREEYVKSIEYLGRLAKEYPKSAYLADARFRQADAMCELGKFSGAILVFEEVINNYPSSDLAPLAWGRKGDCQFALGAEDSARYEEAIRSYRVVIQSPDVRRDQVLQAAYKIARSYEKLQRPDDALDQFYTKVMVPFLEAKQRGDPLSESARVWFTRAALSAADIVTEKQDWRQLVRILERVVEADVAVSAEAQNRIKSIKSENWWLFY